MDVLIDGEIVLYGTVGADLWGDGFSSLDVLQALAALGRGVDVTVRINSPGGNAYEGAAIYNALAAHGGQITILVDSVAASAASLIAMAGDDIVMRPGSIMMIHDPTAITFGDSAAHQKSIEGLEALASTYADVYAEKAGLTPEEARSDMVEETWFTPQQAVDRGYADRIDAGDSDEPVQPVAFNYRLFHHTPEHIVAMADQHGWAKRPRARAAMSAANHRRHKEKSMANDQTADGKAARDAALAEQQAKHTMEIDKTKVDAAAQAKTDERARISAIMSLEEAKGRDDLARHFAHETEMTADQAKAALAKAPVAAVQKQPNVLDVAMRAAGNPVVGADAGTSANEDDSAAVAGSIVTMYRGPSVKRSA